MPKSRRSRRLNRLRDMIERLVREHPPTPWPESVRSRCAEAFRHCLTPEVLADMREGFQQINEAAEAMRRFSDDLNRWMVEDARKSGRLLGSDRTKRLRKKRADHLRRYSVNGTPARERRERAAHLREIAGF